MRGTEEIAAAGAREPEASVAVADEVVPGAPVDHMRPLREAFVLAVGVTAGPRGVCRDDRVGELHAACRREAASRCLRSVGRDGRAGDGGSRPRCGGVEGDPASDRLRIVGGDRAVRDRQREGSRRAGAGEDIDAAAGGRSVFSQGRVDDAQRRRGRGARGARLQDGPATAQVARELIRRERESPFVGDGRSRAAVVARAAEVDVADHDVDAGGDRQLALAGVDRYGTRAGAGLGLDRYVPGDRPDARIGIGSGRGKDHRVAVGGAHERSLDRRERVDHRVGST